MSALCGSMQLLLASLSPALLGKVVSVEYLPNLDLNNNFITGDALF